MRPLGALRDDLRSGWRLTARRPGPAAVALLALALGIGGATAVFSVVYGAVLAPLPYPDAGRLTVVWSVLDGHRNGVSSADFLAWRRESGGVFQRLAAWDDRQFTLGAAAAPGVVLAQAQTPGWFSLMGLPLQQGRGFTPGEGRPGADHVVILTHRFWRSRFASDPSVLGKILELNRQPYTIVGVLPPGAYDRGTWQIAVPLAFAPAQINRDHGRLLVVGRLRPGVTRARAQAAMDLIARRIGARHPIAEKGWGVRVDPLRDDFLPAATTTTLWLLLAAVGFVLLIACADVANLLLAQGADRRREMALRAAVGAAPLRLIRQLLLESLALALSGGAAGCLLGWALLQSFLALLPAGTLPSEARFGLSWPVLTFAVGVSVVTGVAAGCVPAWRAARVDPQEVLGAGGRAAVGGGHRLQGALVTVEFALALTLLGSAGMALHSFQQLRHARLGIRSAHVLTAMLAASHHQFRDPQTIAPSYRQLLARIQSVPGVAAASVSTGLPLEGAGFGLGFYLAGRPTPPVSQMPSVEFGSVTPGYFRVFGMRLIRGRWLDAQDAAGGQPVAVVSQALVRQDLRGLDPLAQRLVVPRVIPPTATTANHLGRPVAWRIVGVYADVRNSGVRRSFPEMLVPFAQNPWSSVRLAVRGPGNPERLAPSVAATVRSLDPGLPLTQLRTMDQIRAASLFGDRFDAALFAAFALLALALAAVGVYGVTAFAVARRTREIGLRMALGADRGRILAEVLGASMRLAATGAAAGVLGAAVVGQLIRSLLYGVGAWDPASLAAAAAILLAAAWLGCLVPARRALRVDPLAALRDT